MKGAYHKRYSTLALFVDITLHALVPWFVFASKHHTYMDKPLNVNIS